MARLCIADLIDREQSVTVADTDSEAASVLRALAATAPLPPLRPAPPPPMGRAVTRRTVLFQPGDLLWRRPQYALPGATLTGAGGRVTLTAGRWAGGLGTGTFAAPAYGPLRGRYETLSRAEREDDTFAPLYRMPWENAPYNNASDPDSNCWNTYDGVAGDSSAGDKEAQQAFAGYRAVLAARQSRSWREYVRRGASTSERARRIVLVSAAAVANADAAAAAAAAAVAASANTSVRVSGDADGAQCARTKNWSAKSGVEDNAGGMGPFWRPAFWDNVAQKKKSTAQTE